MPDFILEIFSSLGKLGILSDAGLIVTDSNSNIFFSNSFFKIHFLVEPLHGEKLNDFLKRLGALDDNPEKALLDAGRESDTILCLKGSRLIVRSVKIDNNTEKDEKNIFSFRIEKLPNLMMELLANSHFLIF